VCGGRRRGPQVSVDVSQGVRQQSGDVGVDRGEPGAGRGSVLTAQDHRVLPVWGVQLQQSEGTTCDNNLFYQALLQVLKDPLQRNKINTN